MQFAVKPYNITLSVSTSESKIVKSASNWVSYTFLWLTTYQYLHHVMYWNPLKKTVKNKCEKPFTLIVWPQICSPQTNRKPWRVWKHGKTGVPVTASPRISTLSGTWTRSRGPLPHCHTARFVFLFTFHQKSAIPLMPFPRFHLPLAKRVDTMKVHSRELIKSSCPL